MKLCWNTFIHIYTYRYTWIQLHINTFIQSYVHTFIQVYTYTVIQLYIHSRNNHLHWHCWLQWDNSIKKGKTDWTISKTEYTLTHAVKQFERLKICWILYVSCDGKLCGSGDLTATNQCSVQDKACPHWQCQRVHVHGSSALSWQCEYWPTYRLVFVGRI